MRNPLIKAGTALASALLLAATPVFAGETDRAKASIAEADGKIQAALQVGSAEASPGLTVEAQAALREARTLLSRGKEERARVEAQRASQLADRALTEVNGKQSAAIESVQTQAAVSAAQSEAAAANDRAALASERAAAAEQAASAAAAEAAAARAQPPIVLAQPAPAQTTVTTTTSGAGTVRKATKTTVKKKATPRRAGSATSAGATTTTTTTVSR